MDKDKQVRKSIEDPAVFLRKGSFEGEEAETAEAIDGNEESKVNDDISSIGTIVDFNALFGGI